MNTIDSLEISFNSGDCSFAVLSKGDILLSFFVEDVSQ